MTAVGSSCARILRCQVFVRKALAAYRARDVHIHGGERAM